MRLQRLALALALCAALLAAPADGAALGRRVTVAATATLISQASTTNATSITVLVRNTDASVSMYLGSSTVTTGTGFELLAGASISITLTGVEALYAIVASSTARADVLERGL